MPRARLWLALILTAIVAAVEFFGGIRSVSLALLSDAAHVCMDTFALGIALAAAYGAQRPATRHQTFGFGRLEVLGALANGALLLAATIFIAVEAFHRFAQPVLPHGALMTGVAAFGLLVNGGVGLMLMRDHHADINVRAALYHIGGDALGAAAVIAGGAVILHTGWAWVDPALSLFVCAIIIAGVARVLREATHVLLESVPQALDAAQIRSKMREEPGVVDVHDLHVWSIGTQSYALSAHVLLDDRRISEATAVLQGLEALLRTAYGIGHVTLQFECENCDPDDRVVCTQRS